MAQERQPVVEVALAVAVRGGRVLVARRPARAHAGELWEFPGGKIGEGEDAAEAARRELGEETGLRAGSMEPLVVLEHDYPERVVRLHCFLAPDPVGEVSMDKDRPWRWVSPEALSELAMPAANASILRALRRRLGRRSV